MIKAAANIIAKIPVGNKPSVHNCRIGGLFASQPTVTTKPANHNTPSTHVKAIISLRISATMGQSGK
jgi:hypothetical protein